jgi:hypothetical protein
MDVFPAIQRLQTALLRAARQLEMLREYLRPREEIATGRHQAGCAQPAGISKDTDNHTLSFRLDPTRPNLSSEVDG